MLEESHGLGSEELQGAHPRGDPRASWATRAARRHDARGAQGRRGGAGRVTPEREALLAALAERLGHRFRDLALLDRALTHASQRERGAGREPPGQRAARVPGRRRAGPGRHGPAAPAGSRRAARGCKSRRRAALVSAPSLARRAHGARPARAAAARARARRRPAGARRPRCGRTPTRRWSRRVYLDGGFEAAQRFVAAQFARDLGAPDEPGRRREEPAAGAAAGPGAPAAGVRGRGRGRPEPQPALPGRVPPRRRPGHDGRRQHKESRPSSKRPGKLCAASA